MTMWTSVVTPVVICASILLGLLPFGCGLDQTLVSMDSKEACGKSVYLTDDAHFRVQSQTSENSQQNVTGYFPCLHKFYSDDEVVCISQMLMNFKKCTTRLKFFLFDSAFDKLSNILQQTPSRVFDSNSSTKNEWCSPRPANVLLQLDATTDNATIDDLFFLLEVARITSIARFTFMFADCDSTYQLQHSAMYLGILTDKAVTCTKTFKYYDTDNMANSKICLHFDQWSQSFQCTSYSIEVFKMVGEDYELVKRYPCSDNEPEDLCVEGPALKITMIKDGEMSAAEKSNFRLKIWDEHEDSSEGLSAKTIAIIVFCVFIGIMVLVVIIVICTRGKYVGGGRGGRGISMPSFPSFGSGHDHDDCCDDD